VDHQVEHDVDVGAAALEAAQPLGFHEKRPVEHARRSM